MAGMEGASIDDRIEAVAAALVLTPFLDRPVSRLSGGERRRTHAAAAMVHRPAVLLLDEPTAGVDVQTRQAVLSAVAQLASEGSAVCYTTHYFHELEALDARVAVLHGGEIVAAGSQAHLLARHGQTSVVLDFDGPPPNLTGSWGRVITDGQQMSILNVTDPHATVRRIYDVLGDASRSITNIGIRTPSLESVFLALTGSIPARTRRARPLVAAGREVEGS
jgi:ABC-2 type transport system ATP-binding protein